MTQRTLSIVRTFKETDQEIEIDIDVEYDIHPYDKETGIGPSVNDMEVTFLGQELKLTEKEEEKIADILVSYYMDDLADGPDPDEAYERAKDEGRA